MATILVIEDNPTNMRLAVLVLEKAGHVVACAIDAESGLLRARADPPDLILMDIQLPAMDGLEATRLLRRDPLTAAIPVIALTALAMKEDQERSFAAGCNGYISKPLRYLQLYALIDSLLPAAASASTGTNTSTNHSASTRRTSTTASSATTASHANDTTTAAGSAP